MAQCRFQGKKC